MGLYQGHALRSAPRTPRRRGRLRAGAILRVLGLMALLAVLAHLPWKTLRERWSVLREVRIEGHQALAEERIAALAGVAPGQDLFDFDPARVRQRLMGHPRIANADIGRLGPWGVRIRVTERRGVLAVPHGEPWEIDSAGVLMAPLPGGGMRDLPLLTGAGTEPFAEGTVVRTIPVQRGLEWARALAASEVQLGGRVSEIDVTDPRMTVLVLMDGPRVLASRRPDGVRTLSALRAVLLDLRTRGTVADEVDLRFEDQVIVRPAEPARAEAAGPHARG